MEPQASESADYDAAERCIRTTQERVLAMLSSDDYGDRVDTACGRAHRAQSKSPANLRATSWSSRTARVTAFKGRARTTTRSRKASTPRFPPRCPQPCSLSLALRWRLPVPVRPDARQGPQPAESLLAVTHNVTLVYDNVRYELRIAQTAPRACALICPHDAPHYVQRRGATALGRQASSCSSAARARSCTRPTRRVDCD